MYSVCISPDYSQALCCGDVSAGTGGVILDRRSSTYHSDTPPVGSLVFLAITDISGTSRRSLRIIRDRRNHETAPGGSILRRFRVLSVLAAVCVLMAASTGLAGDPLVDEARDLVENRKNDAALPLLRRVLEADEANDEVHHLMTKVLLRMQKHDEAKKHGERAIELNDSISDYYLWLARAYLAKAMESGAINAFRYARKSRSTYEKALADWNSACIS